MRCDQVESQSIVHKVKGHADMKTHYPIKSLFLILSVGCTSAVEQAEIEAKQNEERQRCLQLMHETFIAASSCLRPVLMAPLVVTDILCNPCRDGEHSNRFITQKSDIELAASRRPTEGELGHLTVK